MAEKEEDDQFLSHWYQLIDGLDYSTKTFYDALATNVRDRKMPGVLISRESFAEGSILSSRREYLRVRRGDLMYHVCAAPFGTAFFFSAWLHGNTGCLSMLSRIPLIGWPIRMFIRPTTFYSVDTALMFQEAMHAVVMIEVDNVTKANNLKPLEGDQRKPIMRQFFKR